MSDPFLYQTHRMEWWIRSTVLNVPKLTNNYGPFPSKQSTLDHADALNEENQKQHLVERKYEVYSFNALVEIDPILSNAVQGIAGLVTGWFERTDPTSPFASRPSGYVRLDHVKESMQQLSKIILKTFEINKENPDVPEDQIED